MKRLIKTMCAVLAVVLLCGISFSAGASNAQKQILAYLSPDVTIKMDGVEQKFFNSEGKRLYPILYEGSTYLPLRVMCEEIMGYEVGWDQATRTASISTKDVDGVDLLDTQRAYYLTSNGGPDLWTRQTMTSDKQTKEITGKTLTHWLEYWCVWGSQNGLNASFNLEGKYDTMTFRCYSEGNATLKVIGDNDSVLWSNELNGGQLYQEFTVDLLKTNQLTFNYNGRHGFIYDVRLK